MTQVFVLPRMQIRFLGIGPECGINRGGPDHQLGEALLSPVAKGETLPDLSLRLIA